MDKWISYFCSKFSVNTLMLRLNVQDSRKSQHCLWFVIGEKKQQANQSETTHCAKICTNAAHVDLAYIRAVSARF